MWERKTSWKPSARRTDGGSGPRRGNMRPGCRHGLRTPARKANKFGFFARTPGPENQKRRPGCRHGLRTPARKANKFGFRTQTTGPENQERRPGCRRGLRTPARKANRFGFRTQTTGPEIQNRRPENGKTLHRQQLLDDAGFSHYLLLILQAHYLLLTLQAHYLLLTLQAHYLLLTLQAHYLLLTLRAVLGLILELGRLLQFDFCGHFFAVPLHSEGDGVAHLLFLNGLN